MNDLIKVNEAIEALAEKAGIAKEAGHAMHFSQAALNLTQALATFEDYEDRIAELEKDLEQSIEHIDNLQFCSEERGFFYCPNCGEGTKHTKDCYIGVFLDKHKP